MVIEESMIGKNRGIPGMLLSPFTLETYHTLLSSITTIIFTTLEYINKEEEPQETQHVEAGTRTR
jgi:hypothetical protein